MKTKAFKIASIFFVFSAVMAELFCGTFSTVINYWLLDLNNTTEGVVIKSEMKLFNGAYQSVFSYDVEYEYTVDGSSYKSEQVTHGRSDENPYRILKRYPVGKEVTVFYDSSRPDYSVLELTGLSTKTYMQLGSVVFIFFWVFFWIRRKEHE